VPPSAPNITQLSEDSVMVTWSMPNISQNVQFFKVGQKTSPSYPPSNVSLLIFFYLRPPLRPFPPPPHLFITLFRLIVFPLYSSFSFLILSPSPPPFFYCLVSPFRATFISFFDLLFLPFLLPPPFFSFSSYLLLFPPFSSSFHVSPPSIFLLLLFPCFSPFLLPFYSFCPPPPSASSFLFLLCAFLFFLVQLFFYRDAIFQSVPHPGILLTVPDPVCC
jgi:hypothetical protein